MIKRYVTHMHTKTPHERRTHAMRVAGVTTAVVAVVWVTTFAARLAHQTSVVAEQNGAANQTQIAGVGGALPWQDQGGNTLQVVDPNAQTQQ